MWQNVYFGILLCLFNLIHTENVCVITVLFLTFYVGTNTTFQNREVLYEWDGRWFLHTSMRKHLITKQIVPEKIFRRMWRLKSYVNKLLDDFWCLTPLSTIFSYIMSTKLLESLSWIRFYYTSIKQIPA